MPAFSERLTPRDLIEIYPDSLLFLSKTQAGDFVTNADSSLFGAYATPERKITCESNVRVFLNLGLREVSSLEEIGENEAMAVLVLRDRLHQDNERNPLDGVVVRADVRYSDLDINDPCRQALRAWQSLLDYAILDEKLYSDMLTEELGGAIALMEHNAWENGDEEMMRDAQEANLARAVTREFRGGVPYSASGVVVEAEYIAEMFNGRGESDPRELLDRAMVVKVDVDIPVLGEKSVITHRFDGPVEIPGTGSFAPEALHSFLDRINRSVLDVAGSTRFLTVHECVSGMDCSARIEGISCADLLARNGLVPEWTDYPSDDSSSPRA